MSMKVYHAYRCPISRLKKAVAFFQAALWAEVIAQYATLIEGTDLKRARRRTRMSLKKYKGARSERYIRQENLWLCLLEAKKLKPFEALDFLECGMNIWLDGEHAYLRLWGNYGILNKIGGADTPFSLGAPFFLRDYHYQNSSDSIPKGVSKRSWKERGRVWSRIYGPDYLERRLSHTVFELDPYFDVRLRHAYDDRNPLAEIEQTTAETDQ